jgi:galactose mutarotase-like enzyme
MHGRHSNTPARLISARTEWEDDRYIIELVGEIRFARLFGENLVVTRSIRTEYGAAFLEICDRIENRGYHEAQLMLLYHCNFGYPLLDKESILQVDSVATPRDADAAGGLSTWKSFESPCSEYREQVFHHDVRPDVFGTSRVALVNPKRELAVVLRYEKKALPHLTEWKHLGEGEYLVGIEPGTCFVLGRDEEDRSGRVVRLAPGESYTAAVAFDFLHNGEAIAGILTK